MILENGRGIYLYRKVLYVHQEALNTYGFFSSDKQMNSLILMICNHLQKLFRHFIVILYVHVWQCVIHFSRTLQSWLMNTFVKQNSWSLLYRSVFSCWKILWFLHSAVMYWLTIKPLMKFWYKSFFFWSCAEISQWILDILD